MVAVFDDFLEANASYIKNFNNVDLELPPKRQVAVVTCMDARLHPAPALGIKLGDSHIIRNPGGRIDEGTIRSLVISQQLLGTKEIVVLHHTDCGMLTFENEDLYKIVKEKLGEDVSDRDFLPIADLEQSVVDDVNFLSGLKVLAPDTPISGAIYDVKTGAVREVTRK